MIPRGCDCSRQGNAGRTVCQSLACLTTPSRHICHPSCSALESHEVRHDCFAEFNTIPRAGLLQLRPQGRGSGAQHPTVPSPTASPQQDAKCYSRKGRGTAPVASAAACRDPGPGEASWNHEVQAPSGLYTAPKSYTSSHQADKKKVWIIYP